MRNVKQILTGLILFINGITLAIDGNMGNHDEYTPDGSAEYPYLIEDIIDFYTFANNSNSDKYWASGIHSKLTSDLDLNGKIYISAVIAPDTNNTNSDFEGIAYSGIFDGNGHKIYNLTIDTSGIGNDYLGLFGSLEGPSSSISNLNVSYNIAANSNSSRNIGGLCGNNNFGTIHNCYAEGIITGYINIGGLCGLNTGIIRNSHANSTLTVFSNTGGLCGANQGGTILNCNATGAISGRSGTYNLGGLCGINYNNATIKASYATGSVSENIYSEYLGGLCGHNRMSYIINCYATGPVNGPSSESYCFGGLCGQNYRGVILDSFAIGNVKGRFSVGGFSGYNSNGIIRNCYSIGSIDCPSNDGGFCGFQIGSDAIIENCFWDTQTSGTKSGCHLYPNETGTIINLKGLTTIQMQNKQHYIDAGWDFIDETENGTNGTWYILPAACPKLYVFDKPLDVSDSLIVIDKSRINRSIYKYICKVNITNHSNVKFDDITLSVINQGNPALSIEDNTCSLTNLSPGQTSLCSDSITVVFDRSTAFAPTDISWAITYSVGETKSFISVPINELFFIDNKGDFNDSGKVDIADLEILVSEFLQAGKSDISGPENSPDFIVNLFDFAKLASVWLVQY